MTVEVTNCSFKECGDNGDWKSFAAPARFVQSNGSGTMTVKIDNASFTDTKGANGDILLGDGRDGQGSHNGNITIEAKDTAAELQAQEPGYYTSNGGAGDTTKAATKTVTTDDVVTGTGASLTVAPAQEQPPRYYYNSTTTTDTKADGTKGSPKTFDAGVGIYALTAVLSVTGMACVGKKKF